MDMDDRQFVLNLETDVEFRLAPESKEEEVQRDLIRTEFHNRVGRWFDSNNSKILQMIWNGIDLPELHNDDRDDCLTQVANLADLRRFRAVAMAVYDDCIDRGIEPQKAQEYAVETVKFLNKTNER